MVHGGPHATTDADAREIWSLLWKAFGDERLNNGFYEHQDWYPADCWVAAIRETARRGTSPRGIKYLETLAADYKANGVPAAVPVNGRARRPPDRRDTPLPPSIAGIAANSTKRSRIRPAVPGPDPGPSPESKGVDS